MINLGKLKEIKDLRKVWPHEALDFTPWLAEEDNLALLADAVGLEITIDETESSVEISMLIFMQRRLERTEKSLSRISLKIPTMTT